MRGLGAPPKKSGYPGHAVDRKQLERSLIVAAVGGLFGLVVWLRLPFCPLASVAGIPCPGCGLTRATLALAHGDVPHALALHPLVFVLSPLFIFAVLSAAWGFVRGPRANEKPRTWLASRTASALFGVLLVVTLGVWGARFFGCFGGPAPVTTYGDWHRARLASGAAAH